MRLVPAAIVAGLLLVTVGASEAQSLGQFRWQLQPFCNAVVVEVTQSGAGYTVDGFDDQCGGANPRAPLVGLAAMNPDGSIGFGLNIVTTPGGAPVHVRATITLASLGGTWSDSAGNSGTFAFNGAAAGSPRPVSNALAVAALTAAGAVTAASVTTTGAASFSTLNLTSSADITGNISGANLFSRTGFIQAMLFNNSASAAPVFEFLRGRGTSTFWQLPASGDTLGTMSFKGVTNPAGGYRSGALIQAVTTEPWSFTASGARLVFSTNPNGSNATAARMVVDHNGEVGIGTLTPDQLLSVNGGASKVGGGSWSVFSDERLKRVHGTYSRGLADLMRLTPIRFEYAPDNALGLRGGGEYVGFSAQDVRAVVPEAVTESTRGYLQLNADPILWTMLNAVKELKTDNDRLRERNDELERRLAAVEAAVARRR